MSCSTQYYKAVARGEIGRLLETTDLSRGMIQCSTGENTEVMGNGCGSRPVTLYNTPCQQHLDSVLASCRLRIIDIDNNTVLPSPFMK